MFPSNWYPIIDHSSLTWLFSLSVVAMILHSILHHLLFSHLAMTLPLSLSGSWTWHFHSSLGSSNHISWLQIYKLLSLAESFSAHTKQNSFVHLRFVGFFFWQRQTGRISSFFCFLHNRPYWPLPFFVHNFTWKQSFFFETFCKGEVWIISMWKWQKCIFLKKWSILGYHDTLNWLSVLFARRGYHWGLPICCGVSI